MIKNIIVNKQYYIMTRINVGIAPKKLSDKHLLAEHREIKRIPNMVSSGKAVVENIPEEFTLGTGHVKFFYDKLIYLLHRYMRINLECRRRGFNVTNYSDAWTKGNLPIELLNNYLPNERDRSLIKCRLLEKDYEFYINKL